MIQIDMEMPSSCSCCHFNYDCYKCEITGKDTLCVANGIKRSDCPLKEVPSGKWIPVNERLPEPYMFVNATCRSLVDDREDWVIETVYLPIPKEVNKHGYSNWGNIPMLNWGEAEVIAWVERVIPQPYKAESEEV